MDKDIHQPLGTRQKPASKRPGIGRSWVPGLAAVAVVAVVIGVASWMAVSASRIERSETVVAAQNLRTQDTASQTDGDPVEDATASAGAGQQGSDAQSRAGSPVQSRNGQSGGQFDTT
ncbi:MAG: hypothetical protein RID59_12450, partial [Hoeflea sp.]